MKALSILATFLLSSVALAHEGGHGTPEDPIANLPKVRASSGAYGVEGMLKGNKLVLSLRDMNNEVVNPVKSGFKEKSSAEITFRGETKPTKFDLKATGNFYEGSFKKSGEDPKVKVAFNESTGKKHTVVLENLEQMPADTHSHGGDNKPHSHGDGKTHTH